MNTTPDTAALAARTMLATLTVSTWSARKLDKTTTAKTTHDAGAIQDAARVNKHLLAGQDAALKAVQAIASAARSDLYALTLPWNDAGPRILSADLWPRLNAKLQAHQAAFTVAVTAFADDYTQARHRAQFALGQMFSANDFPAVENIYSKFYFDFSYEPLPTAGDFRVELADADADMIRKDMDARANARFAAAMKETWNRLFEAIQHIAVTLPDYEAGNVKRFNDSLTGNLRDLLAILPGLNITNDPALTAIADRAAAELSGIDAQTLRDSPATRSRAATSAAGIVDMMAAHMRGAAAPLPTPAPVIVKPIAPVFDLFTAPVRAA